MALKPAARQWRYSLDVYEEAPTGIVVHLVDARHSMLGDREPADVLLAVADDLTRAAENLKAEAAGLRRDSQKATS